jgi:Uma2 family endonuclease
MTSALSDHRVPWTEQEYLDLGETPDRIELFDGSLYLSPAPSLRHQAISTRLAIAVTPAADAAGVTLFEAINVRLQPGRIPIPDLVIARDFDPDGTVLDAKDVILVCEITSPSNAAADRVLKMHYYAVAGILWYLLIDPASLSLNLYQLDGQQYVMHSVGKPGHPLRFPEPINVEVDPATLFVGSA